MPIVIFGTASLILLGVEYVLVMAVVLLSFPRKVADGLILLRTTISGTRGGVTLAPIVSGVKAA